MPIILRLTLILAGISSQAAEHLIGPDLGELATAEEVAALSLNVFPDGTGLPDGEGNVHDGRDLYQAKCLSCHGPNGQGGSADPLAGAVMGLTDEWPEKTIGNYWPHSTTLFDFIRRSMPMEAPGSLRANEIYSLVVYLLYLNGIVSENHTIDQESLPQIKMPNAEGFINLYETKLNE